jgi:hypothetical protein
MYLHIGNGVSVRKKDIVGIFDLDLCTVTATGRKFINKNQKEGKVVYNDFDLPRSFVIENGKEGKKIRLSRISVQGLKSRLDGNTEE